MKAKTIIILMGLFIFLCFGFQSCGAPESQWKGTIEEIDGLIWVKNPQEGIWDEQDNHEISIQKELQIGQMDGPEEYLFSYISDIAVNSKGDIYVADRQWTEIRKYSQDGEYLITIGRKGQGPGEFQGLGILSVDSDDNLIVYDWRLTRVSIFSDNGELIQTTKKLMAETSLAPSEIIAQDDGYVLFGQLGDSPKIFHEFDSDWNHKESYIDYEFTDNKEFEKLALNFSTGNCFFRINGDILYTKDYYDNKILIYQNKELSRVITRESDIKKPYEVQKFHDQNKAREVMKKQDYNFSTFAQGIQYVGRANLTSGGVFQLLDGNIVHFVSTYVSKEVFGFDVELFDSDGKLLSHSRLGENLFYDVRCKDSNDIFYAIHRRDYHKVIAFRLKY
ncbi:MAG: 6-bladed beta-propeller [Candidatus Aminicenantes bacterium]|nr:6-bladed beta-propeller [Candidatus Aminicenantes bacterium]